MAYSFLEQNDLENPQLLVLTESFGLEGQPALPNPQVSDLSETFGPDTDKLLQRIAKNPINLNISCLSITSLPTLPDTLEYLDCSDTQITSLPTLPHSLIYLDCSNTQITTLPTLPNKLEYLHIMNTEIKKLVGLPDSIRYISFTYDVILNLHNKEELPKQIHEFKSGHRIYQLYGENNIEYLNKCYYILLNDHILSKEIKIELIYKVIERM